MIYSHTTKIYFNWRKCFKFKFYAKTSTTIKLCSSNDVGGYNKTQNDEYVIKGNSYLWFVLWLEWPTFWSSNFAWTEEILSCSLNGVSVGELHTFSWTRNSSLSIICKIKKCLVSTFVYSTICIFNHITRNKWNIFTIFILKSSRKSTFGADALHGCTNLAIVNI